ncbi:MAG: hypothetical protein ABIQ47_06675, partial [Tepidiformaceae bacterium]
MPLTPLVKGNLVRWLNGPTGNIGIVVDNPANGRVRVRLDAGETMMFASPYDALERVVIPAQTQVQCRVDGQLGTVTNVTTNAGSLVYDVLLAGGGSRTVLEGALRPADISDPIALLRQGHLDGARSCNLRLTATRLAFAHQFDSLSSLSNSRVEIKEHQVGVVHRVATSYPH